MRRALVAALLLAFSGLSAPEAARADVGAARAARVAPAGADLREGGFVLAPQAFLVFCSRYPADCGSGVGAKIRLDDETMASLERVNAAVNRRVAPVELRGKDVWQLGLSAGHCAIYAVQKRHDLIRAGLPSGALSLAVVTTPSSVLHLVLVVRTDRGAVVLDNLDKRIKPWTATPYQYRRIQSEANPMLWVSVAGSRPVQQTLAAADEPSGMDEIALR